MNSKERVLTALNHCEPDRVPINFVGANAGIDRRLKAHFGLGKDDREGLLEALNVDFRVLDLPYSGPRLHDEIEGLNVDPQWGIRTRWVENESGGYHDFCDFPLREASLETVRNWPMPSPDDFDYDAIPAQCEKWKDYCVVYGNASLGDIINVTGMLRGMEQTLVDLIADEPEGLEFIERRLKVQVEILSRVLEKAKGKIDLVWTGDDLGTQTGPLIGMEVFRKHIRPNHQRIDDAAAAHNVPVMIHSCGSSSWAFGDFIEMGIKVVDTLQPEAAEMEPAYLKKTFGDRLCFNGCISTAGPMACGTVGQTVENVREVLETMMPGGGYFMAPTHMIQDNSPAGNVVAAYQAALDFGRY
jgi:hypothetical protein